MTPEHLWTLFARSWESVHRSHWLGVHDTGFRESRCDLSSPHEQSTTQILNRYPESGTWVFVHRAWLHGLCCKSDASRLSCSSVSFCNTAFTAEQGSMTVGPHGRSPGWIPII